MEKRGADPAICPRQAAASRSIGEQRPTMLEALGRLGIRHVRQPAQGAQCPNCPPACAVVSLCCVGVAPPFRRGRQPHATRRRHASTMRTCARCVAMRLRALRSVGTLGARTAPLAGRVRPRARTGHVAKHICKTSGRAPASVNAERSAHIGGQPCVYGAGGPQPPRPRCREGSRANATTHIDEQPACARNQQS